MPKKSNIAGVRFGSLVAVEPTDNRQNGYTIWTLVPDTMKEKCPAYEQNMNMS